MNVYLAQYIFYEGDCLNLGIFDSLGLAQFAVVDFCYKLREAGTPKPDIKWFHMDAAIWELRIKPDKGYYRIQSFELKSDDKQ